MKREIYTVYIYIYTPGIGSTMYIDPYLTLEYCNYICNVDPGLEKQLSVELGMIATLVVAFRLHYHSQKVIGSL